MNVLHRAYRRSRWLGGKVASRTRGMLLTGASLALSRSIGESPSQLRPELDTVWADIRLTHDARRALASMRSRGLLRSVADLDIAARKRSSTVFVLGSGSSVNSLTEADWDVIGEYDSIGFNLWLVHDFVPTFYFIELGTESLAADMADTYQVELLRQRLPDLNGMPIIVESKCWLRPNGVAYPVPRQLRSSLFFYAPYYLRTTSVDVVAWVLRRARPLWRHGSRDLRAMVHHRASLSALVLFAFLAGYEEIVLVGVDLNDSRYFWETNSDVLKGAVGPPTDGNSQAHVTVDPTATRSEVAVPIDHYLRLLDLSVLRPSGVTLTVANPASRLSSFLPVYRRLSLGARGDSHGGAERVR